MKKKYYFNHKINIHNRSELNSDSSFYSYKEGKLTKWKYMVFNKPIIKKENQNALILAKIADSLEPFKIIELQPLTPTVYTNPIEHLRKSVVIELNQYLESNDSDKFVEVLQVSQKKFKKFHIVDKSNKFLKKLTSFFSFDKEIFSKVSKSCNDGFDFQNFNFIKSFF